MIGGAPSAEDDFGDWDPLPQLPAAQLLGAPPAAPPSAPPRGPAALRPQHPTQVGLGPIIPSDYDEADDAPTRVVELDALHQLGGGLSAGLPSSGAQSVPSAPPTAPAVPGALAALGAPAVGALGSSAPPAPGVPSVVVAHEPQATLPAMALGPHSAQSFLPPPRRPRAGLWLGFGALALVLMVLGGAAWALRGGPGQLIISVAGPGQAAVDAPKIFVNGQLSCQASPCRVADLALGPQFVRVQAPGYQTTTDLVVNIARGEDAVLRVDMVPASAAEAVASAASAEPRSAEAPPSEESAAPEPSAVAAVEPPAADALSAADLPADTPLTPAAAAGTPVAAQAPKAATKVGAAPGVAKTGAAPAAKGTLRINSVPASNVLVDGKPLGSTPKVVSVAPGNHTIVFVGPNGRQVRSVRVNAGQTQVVAVRF